MLFVSKPDGVYSYRDGKWKKMPPALAESAPLMIREEQKRFLKWLADAD